LNASVGAHGSDGGDAVLEKALAAVEGDLDESARRAAERLADAQLRAELAAAGFTGPQQEMFEREAAQYGIGVFMSWLRSGEVYRLAAAKHRVVTPPHRELTFEERRGLTNLIVAYGVVYFRREALRAGRWRPEGGASLRTFFVGACLLQFKAAYDAWRADTPAEELPIEVLEDGAEWRDEYHEDAAAAALRHEQCWGTVRRIDDPTNQGILVCVAAGLTHAETAQKIGDGLTAEAVGARLRRLRASHPPDATQTERMS
jgi:hypothetical protein